MARAMKLVVQIGHAGLGSRRLNLVSVRLIWCSRLHWAFKNCSAPLCRHDAQSVKSGRDGRVNLAVFLFDEVDRLF
jgi:hypothetical protein